MRLSLSTAVPISAKEFAKWLIPFQSYLANQQSRPTFTKSKEQHVTVLNQYANVNDSSKLYFNDDDLGPGRNIGIAVSGGVDSMALATLLSRHYRDNKTTNLHALIVDHKLRDNSTEEANFVASQVEKLNITPHVLTLNWRALGAQLETPEYTPNFSDHRPDKIHLETKARLERYKAIAKKCHSLRISDLYVGHHQGDQVETVVFRLSRASGIDGLSGIHNVGPLGVLNVVESLGINVLRPLLSVSKERLCSTCESEGTQWVEDPSNRSLDYQRNVIRQYQYDMDSKGNLGDSRLYPLSTTAMLEFRERMDQHRRFAWDQVRPWLNSVNFDTNNGVCHFKLQSTDLAARASVEWLLASQNHVATRLVSFIIRWVNCKDHSPRLEDIHELLKRLRSTISMASSDFRTLEYKSLIAPTLNKRRRERVSKYNQNLFKAGIDGDTSHEPAIPDIQAFNIAGVMLSPPRTSKGIPQHWTVSRQPMSAAERSASAVHLIPNFNDITNNRSRERDEESVLADLLWDQRFFIKVEHTPLSSQNDDSLPHSQIHVRALGPGDVAIIRQLLQEKEGSEECRLAKFNRWMEEVPKNARFTIPLVFRVECDHNTKESSNQSMRTGSSKYAQGTLLSIPSLGIHLQPRLYTVRSIFKSKGIELP